MRWSTSWRLSLPWLGELHVQVPKIIFALPGIVLATIFVTFPSSRAS